MGPLTRPSPQEGPATIIDALVQPAGHTVQLVPYGHTAGTCSARLFPPRSHISVPVVMPSPQYGPVNVTMPLHELLHFEHLDEPYGHGVFWVAPSSHISFAFL